MIYFDHNANTPMYPLVVEEMKEIFNIFGNPSSVHQHGQKVISLIRNYKDTIANFFEINPNNIIFTSGATEANNLVVKSFAGKILLSKLEHDSIYNPCQLLDHDFYDVDNSGLINLESLEDKIKKYCNSTSVLVCIISPHNETGVIQPIKEILELCKKYKAMVHCDCVQAVGKIDFPWNDIDSFCFSTHKIGGMTGAGCLISKDHFPVKPQINGGGQQRGLRSGTENFFGIASTALALKHTNNYKKPYKEWTKLIQDEIKFFCSDCVVFGDKALRVDNTLCISMPFVKNEIQIMNFDLNGISVSSGSACSSGKIKVSRSLINMGFSEDIARCALRISLGWNNTIEQVKNFIDTWKNIYTTFKTNLT